MKYSEKTRSIFFLHKETGNFYTSKRGGNVRQFYGNFLKHFKKKVLLAANMCK